MRTITSSNTAHHCIKDEGFRKALIRTQASGQLLVPPWSRGSAVEAGEQAVPRKSEALVAHVIDG